MKNITWNKEELKEIKKIILIRANLKVNEENELITSLEKRVYDAYGYADKSLYKGVYDEISKLLYIEEKDNVKRVLINATKLKENNNSNIGFITTISKVNPNNLYEIFIIFKEIIAQYEHFSYFIAKKIVDSYENLNDARCRVKKIIETKDETNEEKLIKMLIEKTFIASRSVTDDELFKPLINKLNSMIKERLILHLNHTITSKNRKEYIQKKNEKYDYLNNVKKRIIR